MQQNIKRILESAQMAAQTGDRVSAEQFYKQALRVAEVLCGEDSAGVASVLLDMEEFYRTQHRAVEAQQAHDRMRRIMAQFLKDGSPDT